MHELVPKNPAIETQLSLKLPAEWLNIGTKAEAWLKTLSEVVWWDGFTRGLLAGVIGTLAVCLVLVLINKRGSP